MENYEEEEDIYDALARSGRNVEKWLKENTVSKEELVERSKNLESLIMNWYLKTKDEEFAKFMGIKVERQGNIDQKEFEKITGFKTPEEMRIHDIAYEGAMDTIIKWIKKWKGETNSALGELLWEKFTELKLKGNI